MNEFVERLGWVLVHSLWQFALMALLAGVTVQALRRRSAALRYVVLVVALVVSVAAPLATWFCLPNDQHNDLASRAASAPGLPSTSATRPGANATRLAKSLCWSFGKHIHVASGAATETTIATTSTTYRSAADRRRSVWTVTPASKAMSANCHSECTSTQPRRSTKSFMILPLECGDSSPLSIAAKPLSFPLSTRCLQHTKKRLRRKSKAAMNRRTPKHHFPSISSSNRRASSISAFDALPLARACNTRLMADPS